MKVHRSITDIQQTHWKSSSVFTDFNFLKGLEQTKCVGQGSGWDPLYFESDSKDSYLYAFEKTHSYGEYIFDWGWAEAYQRHGKAYYPKLTSMVPFTPASVDHFIMETFSETKASELLTEFHDFFLNSEAKSSHFLFIKERAIPVFESCHYLIRESFQYHFFNKKYSMFSDFLSLLKSRKAKQIKKERESLRDIEFKQFSGDKLSSSHAIEMYQFYASTIMLKNSNAYLSKDFFKYLFESLKNNIVYVQASIDDAPIAGSFFLFDQDRLYGRYWGALKYIKNLHFELCYYQGIEILIEKELDVFEAGAQGEHKIARGFVPVRTYSAHFMRDKPFNDAIANFINEEKKQIDDVLKHLHTYLPFRGSN